METTSSRPGTTRGRRRGGRRRLAAVALAGVLVLVAAACEPSYPVFEERLNNADAAAAWLVADAASGSGSYTAGNEADLIFALAASYGDEGVARAALARLEAKTPSYVFPTPTYTNYGALAKVMLAVQTLRGDVHDFAGRDLEATLRAGMLTTGPDAGRFTNTSTFTQPLALSALDRTTAGAPAPAGAWLASKQCPGGGFSWGACSQVDADHTGIALQALQVIDGQAAARDAAIGWLLAHQGADGGWPASNSPDVSNTNSTGLAVAGLRGGAGSHDYATVLAAVQAGGGYVASVQYTDGTDAGAVPWTAGDPGSLFLATTQGVFAWGSGPIRDLAFPKVVGAACPGPTGVTVVVDFTAFNNTIEMACAPGAQASGWTALVNAGFTLGSVPGFEGQAICQIDKKPAEGYPSCWYEGFWSYFHTSAADPSQWEFSSWGVANRVPPEGTFEGWRYEPDLMNHWAAPPRRLPVR